MITVEGLTKRFGNTVAIDDLHFSVQPGRVTGFLGPNGSGKSTTLRCMVDLDHPQSGNVTFSGKQYRQIEDPIRTIGVLLDASYVHPGRSARHHLEWLALSNHLDRRESMRFLRSSVSLMLPIAGKDILTRHEAAPRTCCDDARRPRSCHP